MRSEVPLWDSLGYVCEHGLVIVGVAVWHALDRVLSLRARREDESIQIFKIKQFQSRHGFRTHRHRDVG